VRVKCVIVLSEVYCESRQDKCRASVMSAQWYGYLDELEIAPPRRMISPHVHPRPRIEDLLANLLLN